MLIHRAEIDGKPPADVRIAAGRIVAIADVLSPASDEPCIDAFGGALLPGLHDHHMHLFALARAAASVSCGPPAVRDRSDLAAALARADRDLPGSEWIRGVAYHESVAGELDRSALDLWVPERPVRIQQRSGALWMLNSPGLALLGLDGPRVSSQEAPAGVDLDERRRPTGRLFRLDAWLRDRLENSTPPDLAPVGRRLASYGVTGITDATPGSGGAALGAFVSAVASGALPQRLVIMGDVDLPIPEHPGVERGALKVMLSESDLPDIDELTLQIARAHEGERPVAIHCVTRAEIVVAVSAFAAAGCLEGDRVEHASVAPPEVMRLLAALPLTVVTQPNFIRERGDGYLSDVEARDRDWLYRGRGFLEAAIPLGAGTDAPFGDPDPWLAMRAAVDRRSESGVRLGAAEALTPEQALALFTTTAAAPGGSPRPVALGERADLCLLDRPWQAARRELSSECVVATLRDGEPIWSRSRIVSSRSGIRNTGNWESL